MDYLAEDLRLRPTQQSTSGGVRHDFPILCLFRIMNRWRFDVMSVEDQLVLYKNVLNVSRQLQARIFVYKNEVLTLVTVGGQLWVRMKRKTVLQQIEPSYRL